MSSPMMTRILGFLSAAGADIVATNARKASEVIRATRSVCFLNLVFMAWNDYRIWDLWWLAFSFFMSLAFNPLGVRNRKDRIDFATTAPPGFPFFLELLFDRQQSLLIFGAQAEMEIGTVLLVDPFPLD